MLYEVITRKGRLTPQLARAYQQELYWLNVTMVTQAHVTQAAQLLRITSYNVCYTKLLRGRAFRLRLARNRL